MQPNGFNPHTALDLVNLCNSTYEQYSNSVAGTPWQPPEGYQLELVLTATWERAQPPIGFIATRDDTVYIAWRGTIAAAEWGEDAKTGLRPTPFLHDGSQSEVGFTELYWNSRDPQKTGPGPAVSAWLAEHLNGRKIFITGHSLGASLAELNAVDLSVNQNLYVSMFSFAAPRTGNPQFAAAYGQAVSESWRVYNTNDPVPNSVPEIVPAWPTPGYYVHVKQAVPITFGTTSGGFMNHLIGGYVWAIQQLVDSAKSDDSGAHAA